MKLGISSFADAGNLEDERLVLTAEIDLDVGKYAVFWSSLSDSRSPTSGKKTAYWFPDGDIKAGDLVILYTKQGKNSKKEISGGRTAHFYYWGIEKALWGEPKSAVVLYIGNWASKPSDEL